MSVHLRYLLVLVAVAIPVWVWSVSSAGWLRTAISAAIGLVGGVVGSLLVGRSS